MRICNQMSTSKKAQKKAVILLSGGMDSTTALAVAQKKGFCIYALTVQYGQRHRKEIESAKKICRKFGLQRHLVIEVDLRKIGRSSLTDKIAVPKGRSFSQIMSRIPATYVPARNTIFLSLALAWAESLGARDIFVGVNALDHAGYPDCRLNFVKEFERLANLATKAGVEGGKFRIHTPLINLTKKEIIQLGVKLGVDFSKTHTCFDPTLEGLACGVCDSCRLRLEGFREAGLTDPVSYVETCQPKGNGRTSRRQK